MRAIVCHEYASPETLEVSEIAKPVPRDHEVLVRVHATGLGFVDALTVAGLYQIKPPLPFIPGSESSGEIEAMGAGVSGVAPGQRVLCMGGNGGLAEFKTLPASGVIPIPNNLSFEDAASFMVNYCTALHGLQNCGHLQTNETVLILGASGGVGIAAIDVANALGAKVIAAASTHEKRAACLAAGAHAVIDYTRDGWRNDLKDIAPDGQVNVVYDPVGGSFAEPALRCLAPDGRFLVVGFAAGEIPRVPLNLPLLKRCSIVGVNWGASMGATPGLADKVMTQLMNWIETAALKPKAGRLYDLDDAGVAMMSMLNREAIGKVVVRL